VESSHRGLRRRVAALALEVDVSKSETQGQLSGWVGAIRSHLVFSLPELAGHGGSWKWVTILPVLVGIQLETVRGCVSLKKYNFQGKDVDVTLNSKEENSQDFCLDFVQEFGLWMKCILWPLTCLALPSGSCISRRPRSWQHLAARLPTYKQDKFIRMSKYLQSVFKRFCYVQLEPS
jgi:hypothetical protein